MLRTPKIKSPMLYIIICLVMTLHVNKTYAEQKSIIVFSDSIGRGVLSGGGLKSQSVEYSKRPNTLSRILLSLVEWDFLNWATGNRSYSITSRFEHLGMDILAFNASMSGATVYDVLVEQIPQAEEWKKKHEIFIADLGIVFIGFNDICAESNSQMTSLVDFDLRYVNLAGYMAHNFRKTLYVPLMDITDLYHVTKNKRNIFGAKCSYIQNKVTKSCLNITKAEDLVETRRRIMDFNNVIYGAAAHWGHDIAHDIEMEKFTSSEISSIDCFHPSAKGQKKIADFVWPHAR